VRKVEAVRTFLGGIKLTIIAI